MLMRFSTSNFMSFGYQTDENGKVIPTAIEQAKLYCEDTKRLVHELGTSVGRLLEEIKS